MSKAKEASEQLKKEASDILHRLFEVPKNLHSTAIARLVDCIVMAAMLEVVDVQVDARKEAQGE